MSKETLAAFDIVIVGGGSAGCALAHRISANPSLRVALLEAGPNTSPEDQVLWDSYPGVAYFDPRHHWTDLRVFTQPAREHQPDTRQPSRYEQGRVIGGGSSINGMMANRGGAADYDEWEAAGASGWSWQEVLPYFKRLERDLDFAGPAHGDSGPMPIRRVPKEEWGGFSRAAATALAASGLSWIADQNDGFEPGHFSITINNEDDHRVSTATAYLDTETRVRPNLVIMADTRVRRVLFDGRHVTGVEVEQGGGINTIDAAEVILAAGAIHTPALLLKSGIGPGVHLQEYGVPVMADLAGVGCNLQEHPQVAVSSLLAPSARIPWSMRRHIFAGFRWSSGVEGCPPVDMYGVVVNRAAWHPLGQKIGGFLIWVNKAFSQGSVRLQSADLDREPRVELNLLADPRDLLRLRQGLQRLDALYRHPAMRAAASLPFPSSYTERSRDLAIVSRQNWLKTAPIAWLLDGPASTRQRVMEKRVAGDSSLSEMAADDAALDAFLRQRVHGTWHCCGTAKMGRVDDPLVVVDPVGRVHGVAGLRVADASVMPSVPGANVNLPAIMVGEKMADAVLADWKQKAR